jgi:hypothetical protein
MNFREIFNKTHLTEMGMPERKSYMIDFINDPEVKDYSLASYNKWKEKEDAIRKTTKGEPIGKSAALLDKKIYADTIYRWLDDEKKDYKDYPGLPERPPQENIDYYRDNNFYKGWLKDGEKVKKSKGLAPSKDPIDTIVEKAIDSLADLVENPKFSEWTIPESEGEETLLKKIIKEKIPAFQEALKGKGLEEYSSLPIILKTPQLLKKLLEFSISDFTEQIKAKRDQLANFSF